MKHNQKSQPYPKQRGKLVLAITLLGALLLGIVLAGLRSPWPVTAQGDNPNPPDHVVKLVFIHHSCGENWLTDGHGNLGLTLGNNNYFVSDTNYGWGPNSIGDRTDILNWPEWFVGPDSGTYLDALYNLGEQNSWYTRQLADPGGENQIIMFKSCFPNSALEGRPGDPPSDDDYLTVGSAKHVYIDLLSYFATRQDKLFIAVTAPPLLDPTHSANARAFNNWLVHDWLRDYPYSNVAVFDFYNIMTGPDNHHRFYNGTIEHVTSGGDILYYPTDGDEHPNPTGNQKATDEFIPLLNIYYHRWQAGGPPSQPAPTQPPAAEEPEAEEPESEEPEAEEPEAEAGLPLQASGASIDDFEGTYEPDQDWGVSVDEQTDTSLAFALDDEIAHSGSASLRLEFDIAPASWADVGRSFAPVQDWSDGAGLSMWLRFSGDAEAGQGMSVILFSGDPQDATPFEAWFEISPESTEWPVVSEAEGWLLVELPWDHFLKADWGGESGLSELDPSHMVGIALSFGAPDDSRAESTVWVDDIRLLSEAGPVIHKWTLWTDGPHLRGANIYQRRIYPELDGLEFMGPGPLGPPYTQEDFDQLAALGANYVNISHPGLFTETPPYILDQEVQDNLDHLLDMIAQADMFAVISFRTGPGRAEFSVCCLEDVGDWFDDSYLNDSVWQDPEAQEAWAAMWHYTAEHYRDNPIVVGYDLMVEPNSNEVWLDIWDPEEFYAEYGGTLYDWNQMYPPVVAAIREVDPDTPIIVGGMAYSAVDWLPYLQPVDDPHTVYSVHQYAPFQYTHQWLDSLEFSYPGDLDTDWDGVEDQFDRAWLDDLLSTIDDFTAKHDVPVTANEFGLMRWQPGAAEFMDDQMALFEERGINYALWEWQTSWRPFAEEVHAFNFRLGPDPDNRSDVASSDLMDVITRYWDRNTIRPSNLPRFTFAYETRPDGAVRLSDPPPGASDQNPAFSPDGTRLLFTRFENGYNQGPSALYLLDLVSGATSLLTTAPDSDNVNLPGSSWDAATERITFASDREDTDEVWTIAADGNDPFRVTDHTTAEHFLEPSFSPHGEWIVFEADPDVPEDGQEGSIWKVRADGTGLTQLTDGPGSGTDDRQPNWSPGGDRILFQRRTPGSDNWDLYTIDPDGNDLQQVTDTPSSDTDASWSPDGRWIVYSSDYEGLPVPNIFVIPATGGKPIRVTYDDINEDGAPSWSPDGRWIAFESHPGDEDLPAALWLTPAPFTASEARLADVSHWLYLIDVNLEPETVDQIAASTYDMVVLDFIPSELDNTDYPMAEVVDQLHNAPHPKLVVAYIDIGQAEAYRTYWQPGWGIGDPEWIVGADPDGWEGNFPVAYWYDEWREIWLGADGYLAAILDAGFDGVYLDWIEAYSDENVVTFAEEDGVAPRQEMIWWVEDIADFARAQRPGFVVIAQNAAELAENDDYLAVIDAIAQEQVWFDGGADNDPPGDCPLPRTDADVDTRAYRNSLSPACRQQYDEYPDSTLHVSSEEYLSYLIPARDKGVTIFSVDYALEPENVSWVYETSRGLGFVPFVGNRALDRYVEPVP